jgi:hypothetical protein
MFQKHTRYFITYITKGVFSSLHFNDIGIYFQREDRKRTLTANRSNSCSLRRNMQWCYCLSFHFGLSIQTELNLVAAIICYPSSCMITFCELTLYTFHFYPFIQRDHPKRKTYKRRFNSEGPYNSESETEYIVPKCENHVQVSLICLTRLILFKI